MSPHLPLHGRATTVQKSLYFIRIGKSPPVGYPIQSGQLWNDTYMQVTLYGLNKLYLYYLWTYTPLYGCVYNNNEKAESMNWWESKETHGRGWGKKKVKEGNDVIILISKIRILILLREDQKEAFVPNKKKWWACMHNMLIAWLALNHHHAASVNMHNHGALF